MLENRKQLTRLALFVVLGLVLGQVVCPDPPATPSLTTADGASNAGTTVTQPVLLLGAAPLAPGQTDADKAAADKAAADKADADKAAADKSATPAPATTTTPTPTTTTSTPTATTTTATTTTPSTASTSTPASPTPFSPSQSSSTQLDDKSKTPLRPA